MMKFFFLLLGVTLTLASEEALQEFVNANNLFTTNIYKELSKKEQNFLVSPFSAETVLAFAQSGCKDETAEELRNALNLPNDKEKIESGIKAILSKLKGNTYYSLHTANKMYIQQNFPIKNKFKILAKEIYQSAIENIDFSQNEEAANTINKWVEEQTANKIKNLIQPNKLGADTVAILINALYFKGQWNKKFYVFATEKKDFYKTSTNIVQVDTMSQQEYHKYYESSELDAKFLEMSFKGEDVSMIFVLPNKKEGLTSLENHIDKVFSPQPLTRQLVNVQLPKFKIENKIDFKDLLIKFGVNKLFDKNKADLTEIAEKKYNLYVSEVIQKTFIDLEEDGVEAAAATYVSILRGDSGSIELIPPEPKEFKADHPFIFYLKAKDVIIFAGRVVEPRY